MNTNNDDFELLFDNSQELEADTSLPADEIAEISQLSRRGYQLLKENRIVEAEKHFHRILDKYPTNNYALVGLGDIFRKRHKFREAIKFYTTCLSYYPGNNYAYFGLADCYKALKQLPAAIESWNHYLVHDPKNVTVITRVADAYRKLKDFQASKATYEKVLALDENNAYALIGLGHLHFDFQEFESALVYWEKIYKENPDSVDIRILTSIGNCHRKLKTFAKGLTYFLQALEKDPRNFFALFGAADCYRGMREYENSLIFWLKILQVDPDNKVILTRAGDAFRVLKKFDKAEEFYMNALDIGFDYYAILGLALIHKEQGEYSEAIDKIQSLIRKDPRNHRLYIEAANCYLEQGYKTKAVQTLKSYLNLGLHNIYVTTLIHKIQS
ncbi:MAG: tetratricopeptide repeat protein [Spirochaetales bacterium]|nr:tetratricopeptide repeat protein [Spirochaetales bacterium]